MATVGLVMLLLAMSLLLANGLAVLLAGQRPLLALARNANSAFNQALTLQAQGQFLRWQPTLLWQCHSLNYPLGIACLQRVDSDRYLLAVRHASAGGAPTLWRWMSWRDGALIPRSGGWIDLCPRQALRCELFP